MSSAKITRKLNVVNLIFFGILSLLTLTALPWYAITIGISRADWILFFAFAIATGLSISVGYHRLFSHRAFKTNQAIVFLNLLFGAAAFEQPALMWASLHRDHHRYVDTDRDPYNIKQGFWHAHMGWILFWCQEPDYSNVEDLQANPLIRHQDRHYIVWAVGAGILLPLIIGAATGHFWGAFLVGVVGRLTFVHHSTWSINSICHAFGRATYDIDATARDHWLVAIITNGEGYHNFHHRFASDYRNGIRWYHWDPSKWTIAMLSRVGLAQQLYRVSPIMILSAKVTAEHQRVERELGRQRGPDIAALLERVRERYGKLKTALNEWEYLEKEYRRVREAVSEKSLATIQSLRQQVAERRRAFVDLQRTWTALINTNPLIPRIAHV